MDMYFGNALFLGTLQNGVGEWAIQQAGQNGNDIKAHVVKSRVKNQEPR
jgi:hypothetical protein